VTKNAATVSGCRGTTSRYVRMFNTTCKRRLMAWLAMQQCQAKLSQGTTAAYLSIDGWQPTCVDCGLTICWSSGTVFIHGHTRDGFAPKRYGRGCNNLLLEAGDIV